MNTSTTISTQGLFFNPSGCIADWETNSLPVRSSAEQTLLRIKPTDSESQSLPFCDGLVVSMYRNGFVQSLIFHVAMLLVLALVVIRPESFSSQLALVVDFDAAVSMHRVRPWVKAERRLERLASPGPADNRISYGCINLPRQFYEGVLSPAVRATGAVVYVLPEASTPRQVFGSYDIPHGDVLALFRK